MINREKCMAWAGAAMVSLGAIAPARAALLVYEGFDGYVGNLGGKAPNANTIGLKQNVNYAGSGVSNMNIGAGLSLSNLHVNGGSGSFSGGTVVASAQLNQASAYQGTLWGSYLVNLTARGTATGDGMEVRLASDDSTGNNRFRAQADSRNMSATRLANGYDSSPVDGGNSLELSTTYIVISRFTNVGVALSAGTTGAGTSWALTAAQFDALKAAADPEAYLLAATVAGGHVTARAADAAITSGTFGFADGNRVHYLQVGDTGRVDEVRYGSTLGDVTPVPEPATIGLIALGTATLGLRRRRD